MRIIMISDLHITPDFDMSHGKIKIIRSMCDHIRVTIPKTEEVIFFVFGDVGDHGDPESYQLASKVLDYMFEQLHGWKVFFEFIPGNHDLSNGKFCDFDRFISKYQNTKHQFNESPAFSVVYGNINFIFINSIVHRSWQNGQIDSKSIDLNTKLDLVNVMVLHHSLINEDSADHSSISDTYNVLSLLPKNKIEFVLHGHTHECRRVNIGDNIQLIGVGSLLARMDENDNNQFNVIQIQKNKINKIVNCRYISGLNRFLGYTIYPSEKGYTDPLNITKNKYEVVEDYIERKVLPYSLTIADQFTQYFNLEKKKPLLSVINENNLVLVLSDAGVGKSVELNQLAYLLSDDNNPFYPVRINLNTYVDQKIVDLLPEKYKLLDPDVLFWIIDGFDELEPQYVNCFKRRLQQYLDENPQVHILLSSRSNFCKVPSVDDQSDTLPGFFEYGICPLDKDDVSHYVTSNGLDYTRFFIELEDKRLTELQYIPFYLIHMVSIYRSKGGLPAKSDLLDELIVFTYKYDSKKYDRTTPASLADRKIELLKHISRISLSLQLLQRNYITEDEYQELFPSYDVRSLVRYSGIMEKVSGVWKFSHNNFREYLAAKCLLSMSSEEILGYITYSGNKTDIRPEWINTLSFYIAIDLNTIIFDWLVKNCPKILVRFEHDRVPKEMRFEILKNIFSQYKVKNIWFRDDERDLARFSQSNEAIDYLLEEISCPVHFRSQHLALRLLLNFDNYFNKIKDIRRIILSICSNPNTRPHECRVAIKILARVYNEETTKDLVELFIESSDSDIRCGMYEYFVQTGSQDKFISYFLSGIGRYKRHQMINASEIFALTAGLKKLTSPAAIKEAITFFAKANNDCSFHDEEEILDSFCKKAENIYLSGDISIFDTILQEFIYASNSFNRKYTNTLLNFFIDTHSRRDALGYVLKQNCDNIPFILEDLIGDDLTCKADFADYYKRNMLPDSSLFINYVCRMPQDSPEFRYYSKLIKEKEGVVVPKREIVKYEELRRKGEQIYFDSLFSKSSLKRLLDDLIALYGKTDITYEELSEIYIERSERRKDIELLRWAICNNDFRTEQVEDFFTRVPWESFSTHQIYMMLSSDSYGITVSEQQKQYIKDLFNGIIMQIDFNKAVEFISDSEWTITSEALYAITFLGKFEFPCKESILLDMLMIPPHYFDPKNNQNKISSYISTHVNLKNISTRIEENILNRKLMGDVFCIHIEYCLENNLSVAVPIATEVCLNPGRSSWCKCTGFEYLLKLKGENYIYKHILPYADDDLFMDIVRELYKSSNTELESVMVEKYKAKGGKELLRYLILMNSEYGVDQYKKIIIDTNKTPDYNSQIPEITEAIGCVKNIRLLPQLIELAKLLFGVNDENSKFGGLYGSLTKALTAMGTEDNYITVKYAVEKLKNEMSDVLECVGFCNRILDDMNTQNLKDNDIHLTLTDVLEIIKKLK